MVEEGLHGGVQRLGVLGGNDGPVLPVGDDFPGAVDVGHDGREPHRAGLDDHVREAFAAARVDQGVGGGVPGPDIGLPAVGKMDMVVPGDDFLGLVQDGLPFGFFSADEEEMDLRLVLFQHPEGLDELVDALVPVQPAHENEGEAVVGDVVEIP